MVSHSNRLFFCRLSSQPSTEAGNLGANPIKDRDLAESFLYYIAFYFHSTSDDGL